MTDTLKLNEIKELTSTLYSLKGLSEELSQEKDAIMSSAGQISYASKQFKNHSDKFEEQIEHLNKNIQATISQEIKSIGRLIAEESSRSFIDTSTSQTETSIKKLLEITQECQDQIEKVSQKSSIFSRWFMTSILGSALIGGLIGGTIIHYTFPKIDQEMLAQFRSGEAMQIIWSKLDQKEKDKLSSIYLGKKAKN